MSSSGLTLDGSGFDITLISKAFLVNYTCLTFCCEIFFFIKKLSIHDLNNRLKVWYLDVEFQVEGKLLIVTQSKF